MESVIMPLSIQLELSDKDLEYFNDVLKTARNTVASESEESIINKANKLLTSIENSKKLPSFVTQRFQQLDVLIRMIKDEDWSLPQKEKAEVLNILAYFIKSYDLIPDNIPGIGYLDEAILVELVVQESIREYKNYLEFANFKDIEEKVRHKTHSTREDWEEHNRIAMYQRMRNRQSLKNIFGASKDIDIF